MTTQGPAQPSGDGAANGPVGVVPHAAKAWDYFRSLGSPKFHVAPMVDQSELPFRMLCRKYGSTAAYTPMLHSRLFLDDPKYRQEHFTTCEADRPLFAQFCAHDPATLVGAALLVTGRADYIDLNLGCPQRIAKRGRYGAFLMDDLPLVQRLVEAVSKEVPTPVSVKVRVFPELQATLDYVLMLQSAGAMVLAVHGRTRDQKDLSATRADWDKIRAVKQALSIPVLANGNVRDLRDALALMDYTGCDGVLSAESLLADPALFFPSRLEPGRGHTPLEGLRLLSEYLGLVAQHPVPTRMVRGHVHKMAGAWLSEFTDVRQKINSGGLDVEGYIAATQELISLAEATGRTEPVPKLSQRALERLEKEAARQAAMEEQAREDSALAALEAQHTAAAPQHTAPEPEMPALPTDGQCADCGGSYGDVCAGGGPDMPGAAAVRADRQGGREGSECSETCHGDDAARIANGHAAPLAPAAAAVAATAGCERKRGCECDGHPEAAGAGKRPAHAAVTGAVDAPCGGCAEYVPA